MFKAQETSSYEYMQSDMNTNSTPNLMSMSDYSSDQLSNLNFSSDIFSNINSNNITDRLSNTTQPVGTPAKSNTNSPSNTTQPVGSPAKSNIDGPSNATQPVGTPAKSNSNSPSNATQPVGTPANRNTVGSKPTNSTCKEYPELAIQIKVQLNQYRADKNLKPLVNNNELQKKASDQCTYMVENGFSDYNGFSDSVIGLNYISVNVAFFKGYTIDDNYCANYFVSEWKNSHNSNRNMLCNISNVTGIAVCKDETKNIYYAVMINAQDTTK